jgi:hypothetical protein
MNFTTAEPIEEDSESCEMKFYTHLVLTFGSDIWITSTSRPLPPAPRPTLRGILSLAVFLVDSILKFPFLQRLMETYAR